MSPKLDVAAGPAAAEQTFHLASQTQRLPELLAEESELRIASCPSLEVLVESDDAGPVRQLSAIFSAATVPNGVDGHLAPPTRLWYQVKHQEYETAAAHPYQVRLNGRDLFRLEDPDQVLRFLEVSITSQLVRSLTEYHLIHAGAVARNGRGILFPGASGAGKSTLVAALALSGFDYCSDEVAVLGADARLRPFPKVVSLRAGGWQRVTREFAEATRCHLVSSPVQEGIWYLQALQVPDEDRVRTGYPVEFIVLPSSVPSKKTALTPIPKSAAMRRLVEQSLDLPLWGAVGFGFIVELVRHTECYALTASSLTRAAEILHRLTD